MVPSTTHIVPKARILIADDHPMFRNGLRCLIDEQSDLVCCAEAQNSDEVWSAIQAHEADLVILDLRLGAYDGLELIKELKAEHPLLRILVLTQHSESVYVEMALKAGAMGFIDKEEGAPEILQAVRTVLAGEVYLTRAMAALFLHRMVRRPIEARGEPRSLSERELHVIELLGAGLSTREIASRLSLSFKTVETHRENIKRKLGLRGAAELVHFAMSWAGEHVAFGPVQSRVIAAKA